MRFRVVQDDDSLSARAHRGDQEMHAPKLKQKPLHREWGGNGKRDGQDLGGAHRSDEHHALARALAVVAEAAVTIGIKIRFFVLRHKINFCFVHIIATEDTRQKGVTSTLRLKIENK